MFLAPNIDFVVLYELNSVGPDAFDFTKPETAPGIDDQSVKASGFICVDVAEEVPVATLGSWRSVVPAIVALGTRQYRGSTVAPVSCTGMIDTWQEEAYTIASLYRPDHGISPLG